MMSSVVSVLGTMLLLLSSRPADAFSMTTTTTTTILKKTTTNTRLYSSYMDSLSSAAPLDTLSGTSSSSSSAPSTAAVSSPSSTGGFEYVPILSLDHADTIVNNVIAVCKRNGFNPVAIQVLDASGNPIVTKRMDGCSVVGYADFAFAKAYSCVVNKYPSRMFRDRYTTEEASAKFGQMLTMSAISGHKMAPFPGGILLKLNDHIIGAVGVSGAAGDEDEYCAIRGVFEADLGLVTVPEVHSCATVKDNF